MLSRMPCDIVGPAIAPGRLYDAVHLLLTLQVMYVQAEPNLQVRFTNKLQFYLIW